MDNLISDVRESPFEETRKQEVTVVSDVECPEMSDSH